MIWIIVNQPLTYTFHSSFHVLCTKTTWLHVPVSVSTQHSKFSKSGCPWKPGVWGKFTQKSLCSQTHPQQVRHTKVCQALDNKMQLQFICVYCGADVHMSQRMRSFHWCLKKKHKWLIHDWQSQIHYGNIHWLLPNKDLNLIPFEENRVRLEQPPRGKLWQHQVGSVNCLHGHQGKKQLSCRPKRSFLYQQTGLLTSTIQDVQVSIPWLFVHCNHDNDETKPKTR